MEIFLNQKAQILFQNQICCVTWKLQTIQNNSNAKLNLKTERLTVIMVAANKKKRRKRASLLDVWKEKKKEWFFYERKIQFTKSHNLDISN